MAGVKQFDPDLLLERAMGVFWRNGYQGTSIQDLVEATGVNRGSLYATYGDKCGLFLAVLGHYGKRIGRPTMATLSDADPRRAIEGMFESIISRIRDPQYPRGCLLTNTSLECPAAGEEIGRSIADFLGQQETEIYQVLKRAQSDGVLDPHEDARALARFFVGVAQGLNVVNKASPDPAIVKDIVKVAMRVWGSGKESRPSRASSGAGNKKASGNGTKTSRVTAH
jgi:TetR/AcrR family transcriptional regulator, transcriptional repressor for nem operon